MAYSMLGRAARLSGLALIVMLALSAAAPAMAQQRESAGLGLRGLGVRLGLSDPEDASGAFMYGVHVDAGEIVPNFHLVPSVEYWSVGTDVASVSSDVSDLAIKLDGTLDFPLQDQRLVPYLGGGIGIHRLKFETNQYFLTPGDMDDTQTKFGLSLLGGMRNDFTPNLSLFGEVGYAFVSDANQLRLLGGFTYRFIY